jgi:hypothetical protein
MVVAVSLAAELYRLAQAGALLRLYEEHEGHPCASAQAMAAWVDTARKTGRLPAGSIKPSAADLEQARRSHPELALLADRSNPHLSGSN